MKTSARLLCTASLAIATLVAVPDRADACTRVVYIGDGPDNVITGRTLDWKTDIPSNLYVFPQGIKRVSHDSSA